MDVAVRFDGAHEHKLTGGGGECQREFMGRVQVAKQADPV
jgi:hypothetical protein